MNRKILLNQLDKMIDHVNMCKASSKQLSGLTAIDFEMLKQQVENQEFVITVVGAMKSGKSSFTNALLGHDLMPNENQACTLTSTDISHMEHNHIITKTFETGKKEILESENLSLIFHEDVRKSRNVTQNEFFTYKVNYPLYCLKKYPFLHNNEFILMDTPGLNEMEGLGVKKETIDQVFTRSLRRTDLLLFVIDVQYYKSEENLEIIERVRKQRPDLLDSIVFVINKVDKLRERDGNENELIQKIKEFLYSWGVNTDKLYPISARKALLGRLLEQGIDTPNLEGEISSFLPTKTIDIQGQLVTVQLPASSAYPQLIEESSILQLEEQIIENSYLQVDQKMQKSILDRLNQIQTLLDESLKQGKSSISQTLQNLKKEQLHLKKRFSILNNFDESEKNATEKLGVILKKISLEADQMRRKSPFRPGLSKMSEEKSPYKYNTSIEAIQIGTSKFDEWFHKNTEPLFQKTISHYQEMLDYRPSSKNFYYSINISVSSILYEMNRLIEETSKKLPDIKLQRLISDIQLRPQGLRNIPTVNWKYNESTKHISTDSKTEEWEESFLIFFTQKKSRTTYAFRNTYAVNTAKNRINDTLNNLSTTWHKEVIQKRYFDQYSTIEKSILKPLMQIRKQVKPLIQKNIEEIEQLDSEINVLTKDLASLQQLETNLRFRTDLLTKRKYVTVDVDRKNLDVLIMEAESGTTLFLQEGTYELKEKRSLDKSISLIGLDKGLTKVVVEKTGGLSITGNHGLMLEGITFVSSQPLTVVDLNCLELFIDHCHFTSRSSESALLIKGSTEGYVLNSNIVGFRKGISLQDNSKIQISSNRFLNNNQTGISTEGQVQSTISNNHFKENKQYGVIIGHHSKTQLTQNQFADNGLGVLCADNAKASLEENNFINNKGPGLIVSNKASGRVENNQFFQNEIGIHITDYGNVSLSHNRIYENQHGVVSTQNSTVTANINNIGSNKLNGVLCEGSSQVKLTKNEITANETGILALTYAKLILKENQCNGNKVYGVVIQGEATGHASRNSCNNNQYGAFLSGRSSVLWKENVCNGNKESGIVCTDSMSGIIHNNSCQGNGKYALLLKRTLYLNHKYNKGKGSMEHLSKWEYWLNEWRKLTSHLLAKMKKKGKINYEH